MIYVFVVICLFGGALAKPPPVTCKPAEPVKDFDINKFNGMWYEIERSGSWPQIECVTMEWSMLYNFNRVVMQWREIKTTEPHGEGSDDHSSKPRVHRKLDMLRTGFDKQIIATDYTSFAVLYFCDNPELEGSTHILTRDPEPTKELLLHVHQIIEKEIGHYEYSKINTSGCAPDIRRESNGDEIELELLDLQLEDPNSGGSEYEVAA